MDARQFNQLRDAYYALVDGMTSMRSIRIDDNAYHVAGEVKAIQEALFKLHKLMSLGKYL